MRLLIDARTIQDHFPGIGRYVYNLVVGLAPQLHGDLLVLVNPNSVNTRYDLNRLSDLPNTTLHEVAIPNFHWREQVELPRIMASLKPDLVHLPYYVRPFRLKLPSILTLYDIIPRRFPEYFSRQRRWNIELLKRLAIRSSNGFVAISQATTQDFQALYGIPAARITPTPLAADPIFRPQSLAACAELRRRLGLPDRYVLYIGSNKPHKNLSRLVQAWSLLQQKSVTNHPHLIIAGAWDSRYPEAKQLVERKNLADSVHFLGPISNADLPILYSGATMFVFASIYEGFGLPVLEAMACGTSVACSNTSSLPEIAGDAALLFDPYDVQAIADAMRRLLDDADLSAELSQRGLARAAQFSWTRTAQATLEAYKTIR